MNLKPPGLHLFETMPPIAQRSRFSTGMYFQWRQSRGGQEKFHGAVVATGQGNTSRVFNEVAQTDPRSNP